MAILLTSLERVELIGMHRMERDKRRADQIKTILHLDEGKSYAEISRLLFLDDETIRRYQERYRWGGIKAVLDDGRGGSEGNLSFAQEGELKEHLREQTYLTAEEIIESVKQSYGLRYSVSGMHHLLHRLGFVYKKAKGIPGKADRGKQEAFLQVYEELKANKGADDKIYFMDGVHPQHNTLLTYGWILKGEDKEIKCNSGRQRLNLNGVLDVEQQEVIIRSEKSLNGETTIEFFKEIEAKNPQAPVIHIIADNASYYQNIEVKAYLKNSKIHLIPLPPYSPNLNLIERLWKFFKKKVLANTYYESFAEFKSACLDFFDKIDRYRPQLKTLLSENFQLVGT